MLKAYIDLLSQPSRTLFLFLKYTKIPHTVHYVDMMQGNDLLLPLLVVVAAASSTTTAATAAATTATTVYCCY